MTDRQYPIDPDFEGDVFVQGRRDSRASFMFTQYGRTLEVHDRERYETPEDDPKSKLTISEQLRRSRIMTQDPIYQERRNRLLVMQNSGFRLPENEIREAFISVWDRVHDYMAAKDPRALLAQAKRQAKKNQSKP